MDIKTRRTPDYLILPDRRLAYHCRTEDTDRPGLVFLGGYASDMTGTKASFLAERCAEAKLSFLRFDYRGHGQSDGDFKDGTIGGWLEDAVAVIERLTTGPQILVGSSMGGWIALLLAIRQPARIQALIGIAAAPDFTEDLMWLKLSSEQKQRLQTDGLIYQDDAPADFRIPLTRQLIEEGRRHLVLRSVIPVSCPVRLLQGLDDREVPWPHALRISEHLASADVRLTLVKNGDHRLSQPADLDLLWQTVTSLISG